MKKKIKDFIDGYSKYDESTKLFIMLMVTVVMALFVLSVYFLGNYIVVILVTAALLLVGFGDNVVALLQKSKNPSGSCQNCIGCGAVYPSVLSTVYDALKVVAPVLHIAVPPTERQIQSVCPPRADGMPRWAFRVMKRNEGDPISNEDVLSCFRQTLQDCFASHGASFFCTGVMDLYVENVKQDDFAITFFIMPYCPSCTATHIDRLRLREQMQRERQNSKREEHIYDDQI